MKRDRQTWRGPKRCSSLTLEREEYLIMWNLIIFIGEMRTHTEFLSQEAKERDYLRVLGVDVDNMKMNLK